MCEKPVILADAGAIKQKTHEGIGYKTLPLPKYFLSDNLGILALYVYT